MLTKRQSNLIARNNVVKTFLGDNKDIFSLYLPFQNENDSFLGNMDRLDEVMPDKNKNGSGITKTKDELKTDAATTTANICSIASSYAIAVKNVDLETLLNYKFTDLEKAKDNDVLSTNNTIYDALIPLVTDKVFITYQITADDLKGMINDATAFNDKLGQSEVADNSSSVANKNINSILKDISGNIKQLLLLVVFFKKTEPDFVAGFIKSTRISNTGVHHSGIQGIITSAATGGPIKDAVVQLQDTKKLVTSNITGNYSLIKVPSKTYQLIVSATGYQTQTMLLKIIRGKIIPLNFQL